MSHCLITEKGNRETNYQPVTNNQLNMKKLLILLAFTGMAAITFAQDSYTEEKYKVATNRFWHNWFIQGHVSWNAWYGNYEDGRGWDKSPFAKLRSNPSISLAVGKWFTPGLGLRTKLSGIWGKAVFSDDNATNENKYWILNEQAMFNLSNMLCGYNEKRVWNFIPFLGVGVGRSCTYNKYAAGFSVGILNEFRVSRRISLNLELGWNRYESEICGMLSDIGQGIMDHPNNIYAEIGVTYRIGKCTWERVPDVNAIQELSQSQMDALNAMLEDERADNERLRKELEEKQGNGSSINESTEAEAITCPISVFFNINESTIASGKDLVNVKQLAEYSKKNNAQITVTGYADSATGPAEFNRQLSLRRAEKVAEELIKMGVKKENIKIEAKGGVDTLVPPSYNRRAIVEIAK